MLLLVHVRGCVLFWMAAFSAGKPKASQPMGWSTLKPRMRFTRATRRDGVIAHVAHVHGAGG